MHLGAPSCHLEDLRGHDMDETEHVQERHSPLQTPCTFPPVGEPHARSRSATSRPRCP